MSEASVLRGAARFRIEREIADTLQGRIYSGIDLITNQPVVIKEAWRQLVHSERSRKGHRVPENFLKERELVMTLTNLADCTEGLVKGIDEWDDEHCYYYAMEHCEGELFDYISKTHVQTDFQEFIQSESAKVQQPMTKPNKWVKCVAKMFKQICEAVQWMHSNGYCHLDLSLENTMLSDINNLTVKVIDFGLTQKFTNNDFQFRGKVGKLQYMCPEAYARRTYNAKAADVYCLGVMLFMMLIGAPPYQAPQPQNSAFHFFVSGRIGDVLKHWKRLRLITVDALDLMNKMFKYESQRVSLEEVLKHPFFNHDNENENENEMPQTQTEEEKSSNEEKLNVAQSVDKISHDISTMSLEDDHKETPEHNKKHSQYSAPKHEYCNMLLQAWGMDEISDLLHGTGWSNPAQWDQLTLAVLKFEIGLSSKQAEQFLQKYRAAFPQSHNQQSHESQRQQHQQQQQHQQHQHNQPYQHHQRNPYNDNNNPNHRRHQRHHHHQQYGSPH